MKKLMESLNKERQKIAATEAWWSKWQQLLGEVADAIEGIDGDAEVAFSDSPDLTLRITGDGHKLAAAVRILRTRGFSTTDSAPKKGQTYWTAWYYHKDEDKQEARIYLSFSSTACRRVQVGTKIVPAHEEPVYETVCDEITLDRSAEGAPAPTPPAPTPPVADDNIPF